MSHARRRSGRALPALTVLAILGCSGITDPEPTVLVMRVAESRVPCTGAFPQECYLVRTGSDERSALFYDAIEGFGWEPGYRYTLLVERTVVDDPPADASAYRYRLRQVISKEPSPWVELLERTAAAEARWAAADPGSYEIVQRRVCFCGSAGLGAVRVLVSAGAGGRHILAVHRTADGEPVAQELWHEFLTVADLFRHIRWAAADDAHRIEAEFHETAGYPLRIFVDPHALVSDDDVEYRVESVTAAS